MITRYEPPDASTGRCMLITPLSILHKIRHQLKQTVHTTFAHLHNKLQDSFKSMRSANSMKFKHVQGNARQRKKNGRKQY